MGVILSAGWRGVLELREQFFDISRHGYINPSVCVFPRHVEAVIQRARPIGRDGVQLLEGGEEMLGVFASNIFHSKVDNHEGERGVTGVVFPEGQSAGDGGVSMGGKVMLEALVRKLAGL